MIANHLLLIKKKKIKTYFSIKIIYILLEPIWCEFSDRVAFGTVSCVMHKQYPYLNHKLFYWWIQLNADWLLVQTKLCTDRTKTFRRMKIHRDTRDWRNWGIFRKCTLAIKHTYGTYSCSSSRKIWVSKYEATVHTILTKILQFTAHENDASFEKINIISYHILCK